jgi:hypothetical protein
MVALVQRCYMPLVGAFRQSSTGQFQHVEMFQVDADAWIHWWVNSY